MLNPTFVDKGETEKNLEILRGREGALAAELSRCLAQRDGETVVACEYFKMEHWALDHARTDASAGCAIFTVLSGGLACGGRVFKAGDFFLLAATATERTLSPTQPATCVLRTTL